MSLQNMRTQLHCCGPQLAAARGFAPKRAAILRPCASVGPVATQELYQTLADNLSDYKSAPPSFKMEVSRDVMATMAKLTEAGALKKWGKAAGALPERRNVMLGELRQVGVKDPEAIARVSVRNDAAFLITVVGTTSVAAVVLGQLPGDWGFWGAYGTGGISIVVLAIGSVNPAILSFAIDRFSQFFPDYRQRVLRHEAAHFLTGYLLGLPTAAYSLSLGKEHTDFVEGALGKRLIEGSLAPAQVDMLSVIAMAGATSEGVHYEDVIGQTADMFDLQRIMLRSEAKMSNAAQQAQTRWACYQAATLLRQHPAEYEALQAAMAGGASVEECIKAIEAAA